MCLHNYPPSVDNFEFKRQKKKSRPTKCLWTDETKAVLNVAKLLNEKIKNSFHWPAMAIHGEESLLQVADVWNC